MENWLTLFPEILQIEDSELAKNVQATCQEALLYSGLTMEELLALPFTLLIPDTKVTYIEHVQAVVRMTLTCYSDFQRCYDNNKYSLSKDVLIAGAVLHDVGKILEYRRSKDGGFEMTAIGRQVRHPFSGTAIAMKHNIPNEVCHIIATHANEGDGRYRSPEAVLIRGIDLMNFTILKAFAGMV